MPERAMATASTDTGTDTDTVSAGRRLRRLTRFAEALACFGMAAATAFVLFAWSDVSRIRAMVARKIFCGEIPITVDGRAWILSGMIALGALGVFIWAMWEIRELFRTLGNGDFFAESVAPRLKRLGYLALGSILVRLALSIVFTIGNPPGPGQRMVSIAISGADYVAVLAAIIFILFANVMREARRLEDENRSFV
jgi:hypothetical protein